MNILSVPLQLMKTAGTKLVDFFNAVKFELLFLLNRNQPVRPSRMYRLIFSTQKLRKPLPVKEQYIIQEPEYYGNYE
ncbi:MAG: hypothetical protein ACK50E_03750 [Bacteroidota bacterium]|jgi:hypothetical protein